MFKQGVLVSETSRTFKEPKKGPKKKKRLSPEFTQKFKRLMQDKPYTPAELYTAGDTATTTTPLKKWYIRYSFLNPETNKFERQKEYFKINYIKDYSTKLAWGKIGCEFLDEQLSKGFNPFTDKIDPSYIEQKAIYTPEPEGAILSTFTIVHQLNEILKELYPISSKDAKAAQNENFNRFLRFLESQTEPDELEFISKSPKYESRTGPKLNFRKSIQDITADIVEDYKSWMIHAQDLSIKTANGSLSNLGMFWDLAIKKKYTEINPFRTANRLKKKNKVVDRDSEVSSVARYEPITIAECTDILNAYKEEGKEAYITFYYFVLYAFIRPSELTRLKVKDIILAEGKIRLQKGRTKNADAAYVQITPPLMERLVTMNLDKLDPDAFLFSFDKEDFTPGYTPLTKRSGHTTWIRIVHKKLGINKDKYAFKHTGNIFYVQNNIGKLDLKWLQMQNRHSSIAITEKYLAKLGGYFIDLSGVKFQTF